MALTGGVLILCYLSMFLVGFSDNLRGPLFFEMLSHFQVNDTVGSLFFSCSSAVAFGASLFSIWILKRISYQQLLQGSLILLSMSLFGISVAPQFGVLLLAAAGLGASFGFLGVCQNALVAQAPESQRTRALSGLHSMYGVSSFLAPSLVGAALGAQIPWKSLFLWTSIAPLGLLFLSFWKAPKSLQRPAPSVPEGKTKLSSQALWVCGVLAFYVAAEILVSSRLSLYSIRELGLSSEQASRFVTGFFLGLLSGRVFATFVPFPGGHVRQLFVSLSLSFITQVLGLTWSPWFFVLTGLSMSVFYPICGAYIASLFPGQEGTLFSWAMAAQSLLIVVMHVGIGAITDLWGIQMAFYFGLMFLGLSGLSLWRSEVERNKCKTL